MARCVLGLSVYATEIGRSLVPAYTGLMPDGGSTPISLMDRYCLHAAKFSKHSSVKPARFDRASLIVECISGGERGMAKQISRDPDAARLEDCDGRCSAVPEEVRADRLTDCPNALRVRSVIT